MEDTRYSTIIYCLENALKDARDEASGLADIGDSEGSVYADGRAAGLAQALDIVRSNPDGRAIIL